MFSFAPVFALIMVRGLFKRTCKGLVLEEGKGGDRGNLYASRRFPEDEKVHHSAFVSRGLNKKNTWRVQMLCTWFGEIYFCSCYIPLHACLSAWVVLHTIPGLQSATEKGMKKVDMIIIVKHSTVILPLCSGTIPSKARPTCVA